MKFRSESAFSRSFESAFATAALGPPQQRPTYLVPQASAPLGRPDFLGVTDVLPSLEGFDLPAVSAAFRDPVLSRVLAEAHASSRLSPSRLSSILRLPLGRCSLAADHLASLGLMRQHTKSSYSLTPALRTSRRYLWSFELKLHNVRGVVYQAVRALSFSDYSCIVVPLSTSPRLDRFTHTIRQFGIGVLALGDSSDSVRVIRRPRRCTPRSRTYHFQALGLILAAVAARKQYRCISASRGGHPRLGDHG